MTTLLCHFSCPWTFFYSTVLLGTDFLSMKLSQDQVRHVAKLARLSLTEAEVQMYALQLSRVLEYMDILNELDTSDVEPTAQVTGLVNIEKNDDVALYVSREELLRCTNLPVENHQIRVKSIFK